MRLNGSRQPAFEAAGERLPCRVVLAGGNVGISVLAPRAILTALDNHFGDLGPVIPQGASLLRRAFTGLPLTFLRAMACTKVPVVIRHRTVWRAHMEPVDVPRAATVSEDVQVVRECCDDGRWLRNRCSIPLSYEGGTRSRIPVRAYLSVRASHGGTTAR